MHLYSLVTFGALPVALLDIAVARSLHALPEDPAAFPKYRVSYLNALPILNSTAEIWLKDGLKGGEAEFMEQPWEDNDHKWAKAPLRKGISAGDDSQTALEAPTPDAPGYRLEHMKMGPKLSFLCLLPPPLVPDEPDLEAVEAEQAVDPVYAWSLLQPLSGHCLYVRPCFVRMIE
jgi:protein OS-9